MRDVKILTYKAGNQEMTCLSDKIRTKSLILQVQFIQ